MNVYLLRHGQAEASHMDRQRRLTERGRVQVTWVSRRAVERGLAVSVIMHSGKLRARQTAEILAASAKPAGGIRQITGNLRQTRSLPKPKSKRLLSPWRWSGICRIWADWPRSYYRATRTCDPTRSFQADCCV